MSNYETTATLQTPPGRGGIAVIGLCGKQAGTIIEKIFTPSVEKDQIGLGYIIDDGERIDQAIICSTDQGIEINIHGGPHIARRVMQLLEKHGACPETHKNSLLPNSHPQFNNPTIGTELLETLKLAKSQVVTETLCFQWSDGLSKIAAEGDIDALLQAADEFKTIEQLLNPPQIVLAGPPNAGKSTLTNLLTKRKVSIVHQTAGTTRDWVKEPALINGLPLWIIDTAGIWDADGEIDIQAVDRARQCANQADLVLLMNIGGKLPEPKWLEHDKIINVASKSDIHKPDNSCDVIISTQTNQGIDELKSAILKHFNLDAFNTQTPRAFTKRQVEIIKQLTPNKNNKNLLNQLLQG